MVYIPNGTPAIMCILSTSIATATANHITIRPSTCSYNISYDTRGPLRILIEQCIASVGHSNWMEATGYWGTPSGGGSAGERGRSHSLTSRNAAERAWKQ
ncbi:hypothetical protein K440DRAFT_391501 [Wilcoxina mikolae CBS 423.85]|nr:hypothetical protein K440DRAFT_391501 [Wilcoxina mikolae CBS 423.85]